MIDAHQHFWKRSRGDYDWLDEEKSILRDRDYLPEDLLMELTRTGVGGSILVQAAETIAESRFILDLAGKSDCILGVVCWLDFDDPICLNVLDSYQKSAKFVGVRPVLQGISDKDWILAPHRLEILMELAARGLTFDALIQPRHLGVLAQVIAAVPDLKIVIDHGAKPFIKSGEMEPWASEIRGLSSDATLWCKLSGLVTEAAENWQPAHLSPYVKVLFEAFGPDKLMWGSDWPVVKSVSDYAQWLEIARRFIAPYGDEALRKVFHDNAARFYSVPR
nr:amidohydrolase family protein [uncultured Cohaesibacter sp.]